jgi:hypothetical protein
MASQPKESPHLRDLFVAFARAGHFEVVNYEPSAKKLRFTGRVPGDPESQGLWTLVMQRLCLAQRTHPWNVDISKLYFVKDGNQKLVYIWRIIFQAPDLEAHYADIINVVATTPRLARVEVVEIPMPGASSKNVGPMGSVAVGPAAARNKMLGG